MLLAKINEKIVNILKINISKSSKKKKKKIYKVKF